MSGVFTLTDSVYPPAFYQEVLLSRAAGLTLLPLPPGLSNFQTTQLLSKLRYVDRGPGVAFLTSGTVGTSKLIIRSYESVMAEAEDVATALMIDKLSNVLITSPITHSYGFGILMAAGFVNAKVRAICHTNVYERAITARALLSRETFDVVTGVPFMFRMLLNRPAAYKPDRCYAGGETVPVALSEQWGNVYGTPLLQEYGLSEVGIVSIGCEEDSRKSVGRPIPRTLVACTEESELVVHRPYAPTSYFEDEFPETFTKVGVRTGDTGYLDYMGRMYLTGRLKSVIRVAGKSVVPEEVEAVIREFPGIEDVVVIGEAHPIRGEIPVAYVTPISIVPNDLRTWLRGRLEPHKIPHNINCLEELPRSNASGKVVRHELFV